MQQNGSWVPRTRHMIWPRLDQRPPLVIRPPLVPIQQQTQASHCFRSAAREQLTSDLGVHSCSLHTRHAAFESSA
ncbi:hypothetical protein CDD81_4122 [Ophiocordyceps australis]|uniref:Uncharacterized protein n=1 Tax=Ophiocordyceps australis TaxID=1399860 RepID=A0A2C5YCT1_9HYPO|nr:hypothetical protein CDD81_4122 [Ophiocordyceps australis]